MSRTRKDGEDRVAGCASCRERISVRLDGALAPGEAGELDAHLARCSGCRAYTTRLAAAHGAVGRLESRRPVPSALAARIKAETLRQSSWPRWTRHARTVSAAGLAAATIAALVWLGGAPDALHPDPRHLPDLCTVLVEDHIRYLPAQDATEVGADRPEELERWFASRLDFPVRVPSLAGARLLGGRECFLSGRKVALLFYERAGRRISLFEFQDISLGGLHSRPDGTWAGGMHGYNVRAVRSGGTTYALVSDLPETDMGQLIASVGAPD